MNLKKMLIGLALSVLGLASQAAATPDGRSGFASEKACISAVQLGKSVQYVPVTNRNPGPSFTRTTMREAGYHNGACVQGFTTFTKDTWVYLGPMFEIGVSSDETIVMWQCGNAVTSISKLAMNQTVTQSQSIAVIEPQQCDGKCQAVNFCESKSGTLINVGPDKWDCKLPQGGQLTLTQPGLTVSGRVEPSMFTGWTSAPALNVPSAPSATVNVGRPQAPTVTGQSCGPVPCDPMQIGNVIAIEKSPDGVCRIVARDPNGSRHLIAIGKYSNGDLSAVKQNKEGKNFDKEMHFQLKRTDCVEIINEIATGKSGKGKPIWEIVRQGLGLPDLCTIEKVQEGKLIKV